MKILITGDVVGRTGRRAFDRHTRELKQSRGIDLVIVNGENSAGGKGISRKSLDELYRGGADIVTSGNHIWDNREVYGFIDDEPYLVPPPDSRHVRYLICFEDSSSCLFLPVFVLIFFFPLV